MDCLANWFFNQCTTMCKSSEDMSLMDCLDVAPSCPLCRALWVPDAHTIEPPVNIKIPNLTSNRILKLELVRLLEAKEQEEDLTFEDSYTNIIVDEAIDECPKCHRRFCIGPWSRLLPCTHPFHVDCIVPFLTSAYLECNKNEIPIIRCPTCNDEIILQNPWEWVHEDWDW